MQVSHKPHAESIIAKVLRAAARSAKVQLSHHEVTGSLERDAIIARSPASEHVIVRTARHVRRWKRGLKAKGAPRRSTGLSG
jgi:hypothetical protein